jgi:hypothetical protein
MRRRNGTGAINGRGYVEHGSGGVRKLQHILVAERALGRPLPRRARVHHVDENRTNNEPTNLVICPDEAYHRLLHQRMRALAACGHAHWRSCSYCGRYSPPEDLYIRGTKQAWHRSCRNSHDRAIYTKGN